MIILLLRPSTSRRSTSTWRGERPSACRRRPAPCPRRTRLARRVHAVSTPRAARRRRRRCRPFGMKPAAHAVDRAQHCLGPVVGREHDDGQRRRQLAQPRDAVQAVAVGRPDRAAQSRQSGCAASTLRGGVQVAGQMQGDARHALLDERGDTFAEQGMVVDQQQLHRPWRTARTARIRARARALRAAAGLRHREGEAAVGAGLVVGRQPVGRDADAELDEYIARTVTLEPSLPAAVPAAR